MRAAGRTLAIPLAIIVGLTLAPALTGCSGVEGIVKNVTHGNVDIGGNKVPINFPKSVPLIKGTVDLGASVGSGDKRAWNVTITVPDVSAFTTIASELKGAGFTGDFSQVTSKGSTGTFSNQKYGVLVVVAPSGKNGWIANYSVTTAKLATSTPG